MKYETKTYPTGFDTFPEKDCFKPMKTEQMFIDSKNRYGFVDKEPSYRCTECGEIYQGEHIFCNGNLHPSVSYGETMIKCVAKKKKNTTKPFTIKAIVSK